MEQPVLISKGVAKYLFQSIDDAENEDQETLVLAITGADAQGWVFVEDADKVGTEGSGVWVDAEGNEHQGPHGKG